MTKGLTHGHFGETLTHRKLMAKHSLRLFLEVIGRVGTDEVTSSRAGQRKMQIKFHCGFPVGANAGLVGKHEVDFTDRSIFVFHLDPMANVVAPPNRGKPMKDEPLEVMADPMILQVLC